MINLIFWNQPKHRKHMFVAATMNAFPTGSHRIRYPILRSQPCRNLVDDDLPSSMVTSTPID